MAHQRALRRHCVNAAATWNADEKCRISHETIESAIRAEIALHNPRYRWRRWVSQVSRGHCSECLPLRQNKYKSRWTTAHTNRRPPAF